MNKDVLELVYSDEHIVIINKPAGLLTHRSKKSSDRDSVVDRLKLMFSTPPSPVHRLDRATSGLLICTFDSESAALLGKAFEEKRVSKEYISVLRGFTDPEGIIDRPLSKDGEGELQEASTSYERLETIEIPVANNKYKSSRYSLVRIKPSTGRFHQIRRHMAGIGHPVIGDTSHGDLRHNRIITDYWGNDRLLLHCEALSFPHPRNDEILSIRVSVPEDMSRITDRFSH